MNTTEQLPCNPPVANTQPAELVGMDAALDALLNAAYERGHSDGYSIGFDDGVTSMCTQQGAE